MTARRLGAIVPAVGSFQSAIQFVAGVNLALFVLPNLRQPALEEGFHNSGKRPVYAGIHPARSLSASRCGYCLLSGSHSAMSDYLPRPGETPLAVGITPMHPGVFFMEKYLRPRGLAVHVAAEKMLLPLEVLNDVIAQRRAVDDDIAARLGEFTKTSPRVWLNMQSAADYAAARKR